MSKNNPLLSLFAMTTALALTACNREPTPDVDTAATPTTPAVEAAPAPEPMPPTPAVPVDSGMTFAAMDKNSDGGVSQDELADTEMLHQHFSVADTDKDGKLSSAEVDKHRADMAAMPAK